jgi:hypothetical protein
LSFQWISDFGFIHGQYRTVQSRVANAVGSAKTYVSRFEGDTELNIFKRILARKRKTIIRIEANDSTCHLSAQIPGATHSDDVFYYFKSILTPAIKATSIESELIQTMVNLITNFASQNAAPVSVWKPVGKPDVIPNVLNVNNTGLSMIPLPDYANVKVINDIFKQANVDLI